MTLFTYSEQYAFDPGEEHFRPAFEQLVARFGAGYMVYVCHEDSGRFCQDAPKHTFFAAVKCLATNICKPMLLRTEYEDLPVRFTEAQLDRLAHALSHPTNTVEPEWTEEKMKTVEFWRWLTWNLPAHEDDSSGKPPIPGVTAVPGHPNTYVLNPSDAP